ncbi:unnamed protein product, partial [Medioppia subpectinata]
SLIIRNVTLSDSGYYICQINTSPPKRLLKFLIPLQFDKMQSMESDSVVKVRESQNVSLTCKATGNPKPSIIWRKQDGQPLPIDTNTNQIIVPPTITVPNKMVSSYVRHNVTLECITESNPKAQHFWMDSLGNQIIDLNKLNKYSVKTVDTNVYEYGVQTTTTTTFEETENIITNNFENTTNFEEKIETNKYHVLRLQ